MAEQDPPITPSSEPEDNSEEDMAALMGFSTFGSQPLSKKRKYNPKTDAIIDGQELENIDRGGKRGKGSGGNQIPLGKMRVLGEGKDVKLVDAKEIENGNPDEIGIEDEDGDVDYAGEGGNAITAAQPLGSKGKENQKDTISTDKNLTSPRRAELNSVQQKIDAITTRDSYVARSPTRQPEARIPASLPPKPNFNMRGGQRNELWYIGYFDPSFLVNPWEELEKENGLGVRGRWLESESEKS